MNPLTFIATQMAKAFSWLLDKDNRPVLYVALVLGLIIALLSTCSQVDSLRGEVDRSQKEAARHLRNLEASRDSIRLERGKNGELIAKTSAYELTLAELDRDYAKLNRLYQKEKGKPPIVITHTVTEIRDTTIYVNASISGDSTIIVSDSAYYTEDDFRYLTGSIPYTIDTLTNTLKIGTAVFSLEQSISLQTVLTRDKKTGKIEITVLTQYPGLTFTNIKGAIIQDDAENARVLRDARKEWSVGINAGYGFMLNMVDVNQLGLAHGPYAGVGIKWSPKWAQWGR